MKDHIEYTIVSHNEENNSLLVRPYSPLFKNEPDTYPVYNITISNLNQENDIKNEIGKIMIPIIDHIIESEKDLSLELKNQLKSLVNQKINLSKEKLEQKPFDLINYNTIEETKNINIQNKILNDFDIEFL